MTDIRQSREFGKYMESLGWRVERIDDVNYFIRPFLFGLVSFMKVQRPEKVDIDIIKNLSQRNRSIMIVVEPKDEMLLGGYKILKNPYLPSKTLVLDLTKTQKQMLRRMHYKTRYNTKIALKRGIEVKIIRDIDKFANFWNEQRYGIRSVFSQVNDLVKIYKAFGKNAKIITAYKDEQMISGILMLMHDRRAYYMYAASNNVGKKNYASTACTWEAIKLAKRLGCREFDFEGIYDRRFPNESWRGFTRFKKSFGGREVEYPVSLVKYGLYL